MIATVKSEVALTSFKETDQLTEAPIYVSLRQLLFYLCEITLRPSCTNVG